MPTPFPRTAVIFDFDGVLADTQEVAYQAVCRIARRRRAPEPTPEFLRSAKPDEILQALRIRGWMLPYYVALARRWIQSERARIRLFPFSGDLLMAARETAEATWIVSSNGEVTIRNVLERSGLEHAVDRVYGGVGMFAKKRILRRLLKSFELDPRRVIYVGDEARDVEAARGAHVRPVCVTWGYQSAELLRSLEPAQTVSTADEFSSALRDLLGPP